MEDKFLIQVVKELTVEVSHSFVNREGLVGDVLVGGHLWHCDHEMIKSLILAVRRTDTLHIQSANVGLFMDLVDRVPWETVLKG